MTDPRPGELDVGFETLGLISVKRLAKLWECSEKTIRRRIRDGKLEAVKDGGNVRILAESVIAYKQRLRVPGAQQAACGTCGGTPPAGFTCTGCGQTGRAAS